MRLPAFDKKGFLRIIFHSADKLSIKSITKRNIPFILGWIGTFIWLYSYFLPLGSFKFESRLYGVLAGNSPIYYYIWLISGCLIPILWEGKKFIPKTFYSVIVALACFIIVRFTNPGIISKGIMMIAAVCIGHIFASNVYAFFMILNNSEKFYSMVLAVFFPKVLMFAKPVLNQTNSEFEPTILVIFLIMMVLAVCSYFFRYNLDVLPASTKIKAPIKAYSLLPLVFVVLTFNDVVAPIVLNQITEIAKTMIERYYFFGIVIGIAAVLLLQKCFAMNICNMNHISFAFLAIGFVMNMIKFQYANTGLVSAFCFGVSYAIGLINIYYLAGFMVKKFQSISFYRIGIMFATIYYFIAFLLLRLFDKTKLLAPPTLMALISICIVILFFILSPFFTKMLYSGDWIDDSYRGDVTQCSRLEAKLKDYKLTHSEIEVCRLLLDGYTLRQIAGMQSKAYPTINTYCTSVYRKLHINSRAELMLLLKDYIK